MIEVRYKSNTLEIFNGIEEMPITVFQAFNRSIMIDAGIGSDVNDFDQHLNRMISFAKAGKIKEHATEAVNIRTNLAFVMTKTSPRMNAFAALVYSINGKVWEDKSDEGLKKLVEVLGETGLTYGKLTATLEFVKKKFIQRLKYFFLQLLRIRGRSNSSTD
jgi:hypothetical protein